MTRKTLRCPTCGFTVRRRLAEVMAGCRGVHDTASMPARCPRGCGWIPDPDQPDVPQALEIDVVRGGDHG